MDRRAFMLGVGAAALAPVVAPAAALSPTLIGLDLGRDDGMVYFARTRLPAVHWRRLEQGVSCWAGQIDVEHWREVVRAHRIQVGRAR